MKIKTECLLCSKRTSVLMHKSYPGYQEPMTFEIYHCEHCNTSFSFPRVSDSKYIYDNIYNNASIIPGYKRYWRYSKAIKGHKNPLNFLSNAEDTYWGVKEALQQKIKNKRSAKILEVGSGLGYLTYALNKEGYDTLGLDISKTAVQLANSNYGNYYVCEDLFDFAKKENNRFDIVILTEVIEHVNEPIAFIEQLLKLLNTSGHLILTTPNKSFYPSDIIWNTENPPIHSWWFSETSISHIANKLNAKLEFIDFYNFYKDRYYICNLKKLRSSNLRTSILDTNGDVKSFDKDYIQSLLVFSRRLLSKIPYLLRAYKYLLNSFKLNVLFFGRRGQVLCAIMQKN